MPLKNEFTLAENRGMISARFLGSIVVSIAALTPAVNAQGQLWVDQFGTAEDEAISAAAPDGIGGVFVAGATFGSLAGPNIGGGDVIIAHYDDAGSQIWIRQIGTKYGPSWASAIMPDGAGGVYVTGNTGGTLGGPNPSVSPEIFIAHYNRTGTQTWINQFGTLEKDTVTAIAPDGIGGLYLAGYTEGKFLNHKPERSDLFIIHLNNEHKRTWVRQFGSRGSDRGLALASDGVGGVYFGGEVDYGITSEVRTGDAILAHYDITGERTWIRQFGSLSNDIIWALAPDSAGGVFVAGTTSGNLGGTYVGDTDSFLARYDSAGTQSWITQFGTPKKDWVRALTSDGLGGVYATGTTRGDLAGVNAGSDDVFLAHYSSAGTQTWIGQYGTSETDRAHALASDGSSGVYIAGSSEGNYGATSFGEADAFVSRHVALCYADCDQTTGLAVLDVFDFLCFQNSFTGGDAYACDCNTVTGPGVCDVFDFLCFQSAFLVSCP